MNTLTETSVFAATIAGLQDQIDNLEASVLNTAPQALTNRTRYLYDMMSAIGMKQSCICATTANIALTGTQTIDGVATAAGNSVLVKNQNNAYENGVYVVAAGAWSRRFDCDSSLEMNMATVGVSSGTVNNKTIWTQTTSMPTVGSSSIVFTQIYPHSFSTLASKPTTVTGYGIADMHLYSPPGAVTAFAGAAVPQGWLECNGQEVLKASYPALFAALGNGTIYGSSTDYFQVPDLRGEFIRGAGPGRSVGTEQTDQVGQHSLTVRTSDYDHDVAAIHFTSKTALLAGVSTGDADSWQGYGSTLPQQTNSNVVLTGQETRPHNVAMMYIIKY